MRPKVASAIAGMLLAATVLAGCNAVPAPSGPTLDPGIGCSALEKLVPSDTAKVLPAFKDAKKAAETAVKQLGDKVTIWEGSSTQPVGATQLGGTVRILADSQGLVGMSYEASTMTVKQDQASALKALGKVLDALKVPSERRDDAWTTHEGDVGAHIEPMHEGAPIGVLDAFENNGAHLSLGQGGEASTTFYLERFHDLSKVPDLMGFRAAEGFAHHKLRCGPPEPLWYGTAPLGQDLEYVLDVVKGSLAYRVDVTTHAHCPLATVEYVVDAVTGAILETGPLASGNECDERYWGDGSPPSPKLTVRNAAGKATSSVFSGEKVRFSAAGTRDGGEVVEAVLAVSTPPFLVSFHRLMRDGKTTDATLVFEEGGTRDLVLWAVDQDGAWASTQTQLVVNHRETSPAYEFTLGDPSGAVRAKDCAPPAGTGGTVYAEHPFEIERGATKVRALVVEGSARIALCDVSGEAISAEGTDVSTTDTSWRHLSVAIVPIEPGTNVRVEVQALYG